MQNTINRHVPQATSDPKQAKYLIDTLVLLSHIKRELKKQAPKLYKEYKRQRHNSYLSLFRKK